MLRSMTGYGAARHEQDDWGIAIEVRSVNSRYLKINTRSPEVIAAFDTEIEKIVRKTLERGTVSVNIRINRMASGVRYVLNSDVLKSYWDQLNELAERIHHSAPMDLGHLLNLPGAVSEEETSTGADAEKWPLIRDTLEEALEKLNEFRLAEGQSTEADLQVQAAVLREQLEQIEQRAPQVVQEYRNRVLERVRELLQEHDATVKDADLIREVSIFADRTDINEEITRLKSHLQQFDEFLKQEASMGRKLEFLTQEMFREVNTIGSKANNVEIAHCVIEMKSAVEKMREILQNVE